MVGTQAACAPAPVPEALTQLCDPRELGPDEVRARRIPCSDELLEGGDGRRSDWVLENSRLRVVVRDEGVALTRFDVAGGTVVDFVPAGESDLLEEIVPSVGGQWFTDLTITAENSASEAALLLEGTLQDGSWGTARYRLEADSDTLFLEGMERLTLVPNQGAGKVGDVVELGSDQLWTTDGSLSDGGGWIHAEGVSAMTTGSRRAVSEWRWPEALKLEVLASLEDGTPVDGTLPLVDAAAAADVAWIEVREEERTVFRWPLDSGRASTRAGPEATALRLSVAGYSGDSHALNGGVAGSNEVSLTAHDPGFVRVEVRDESGAPLPARFSWGGRSWAMPAEGLLVPTGAGSADVVVSAGPAYDRWEVQEFDVSDVVDLQVVLGRSAAPRMLAELGRDAWPDAEVRSYAEDVARDAVSDGVRYLVMVSDDEVARAALTSRDDPFLSVRAGSRAATAEVGSPYAWPWSRTNTRGAQGAAPWMGLDALDLLAVMDDGGDRRTVVDAAWVAAAGPLVSWDPAPTAFQVEGLDDLPVVAELFDQFLPVLLVGRLTWIEGLDDESRTTWRDVEAMMLAGRTVATNGPYIQLQVDGLGLGEQVSPAPLHTARVRVTAPAWMDVDEAGLMGPGGEELAHWVATGEDGLRLRGEVILPSGTAWVVAWASGDTATDGVDAPPWAVTGPVWLGRP